MKEEYQNKLFNMMYLNSIFTICEKYNLRFEIFIRLYLAYSEELYEKGIKDFKYRPIVMLYKHTEEINKEKEDEIIEELYQKELIVGHVKSLDTLSVSDKFIKEIFINSHQATEELYSVYPDYVEILQNNKRSVFNLKAVPYDKLPYGKFIENDPVLHEEILLTIKRAKEIEEDQNINLINMRIDKFVESKYWNTLFKLIDKFENNDEIITDEKNS